MSFKFTFYEGTLRINMYYHSLSQILLLTNNIQALQECVCGVKPFIFSYLLVKDYCGATRFLTLNILSSATPEDLYKSTI